VKSIDFKFEEIHVMHTAPFLVWGLELGSTTYIKSQTFLRLGGAF